MTGLRSWADFVLVAKREIARKLVRNQVKFHSRLRDFPRASQQSILQIHALYPLLAVLVLNIVTDLSTLCALIRF